MSEAPTAGNARLEFDGREFPFPDFNTITFKEGAVIKRATGLRLGELQDAFRSGDSDGILAVAIIAKLRADGNVDIEEMTSRQIASFQFKKDDEEAVSPDPLPETPPVEEGAALGE